jgi:hypothetical protein
MMSAFKQSDMNPYGLNLDEFPEEFHTPKFNKNIARSQTIVPEGDLQQALQEMKQMLEQSKPKAPRAKTVAPFAQRNGSTTEELEDEDPFDFDVPVEEKNDDDVYGGRKLRRQDSFKRWQLGDYLHIRASPFMQEIERKFGDSTLFYSGTVHKMNRRSAIQDRNLVITDQALYNIGKGEKINRRIELTRLKEIACSSMKDGYFVIKVAEEYDYVFESAHKTEIITIITKQYKHITSCKLPIEISDVIWYSTEESNDNALRSMEFKEDNKVKDTSLIKTKVGVVVMVNNEEKKE